MQYRTYTFPSRLGEVSGPAMLRWDQPETVTAMVDGESVAGASASRSSHEATELWVYTEPGRRRHGYATQVATAGGSAVTGANKAAFYSHLEQNKASQALAARLGVDPLFDLVGLTLP
jgi:predicted GNAT family acetyltransferase